MHNKEDEVGFEAKLSREEKKPKHSAEKIRAWQLAKNAHKLKNRSSKHEKQLRAMKPICRCLSNAALAELSKGRNLDADMEIQRRAKNRAKNEVRKQRYLEKLEAKRAAKASA